MTTALNHRRPSGDSGAVPKLSYRNASPPKDLEPLRELPNANNTTLPIVSISKAEQVESVEDGDSPGDGQQDKPRLSIRQLREQAHHKVLEQNVRQSLQEQRVQDAKSTQPAQQPQQKKKSSLFGGLFQVKEPTQVALNQVAAQLISQHGSTSATRVPNVSMEKMPDFVPKVNSKWDGIPESVKKMERDRKARERGQDNSTRRDSGIYSDYEFPGQEERDRGRAHLKSRNSSSTTGSFGSRGRSSGSHTNSTRARFYPPSVNSSGDLASQQRTNHARVRAASFQSNSASNPSDAALAESPLETSAPSPGISSLSGPSGSVRSSESQVGHAQKPPSTDLNPIPEPASPNKQTLPKIDAVPSPETLPSQPPQETSPASQSLHSQHDNATRDEVILTSSGPGVLGPPVALTTSRFSVATGFPAGEAREFVLVDDDEETPPKTDLPLRQGDASARTPMKSSLATPRKHQHQRSDSSRFRLALRPGAASKNSATSRDTQVKEKSPLRTSTDGSEGSPRGIPSPRSRVSKSFNLFSKEKD
ncbi:hypothetical protein LTR99_003625 [Exophiala xenobiotica]|uniref:Uncharacterized protein n=1 Tax=Vermiconidia calcicola TaxID=1690605 RepID=A0AAV9PXW6_9PEZI|nr:hypothetical protein LTR99_003625 [Exophiala xenobiotica]KAK5435095.1 hypothetical protein LTR34_002596 [Exophiala xenobiotica]KAK5531320.1 hypothetical protein LTR25_008427 [Vermiconidia calcicola]KAK5540616.1 hypothetical protein LTR23_006077 [Chaetothyriales sp. CCFEE 6169]